MFIGEFGLIEPAICTFGLTEMVAVEHEGRWGRKEEDGETNEIGRFQSAKYFSHTTNNNQTKQPQFKCSMKTCACMRCAEIGSLSIGFPVCDKKQLFSHNTKLKNIPQTATTISNEIRKFVKSHTIQTLNAHSKTSVSIIDNIGLELGHSYYFWSHAAHIHYIRILWICSKCVQAGSFMSREKSHTNILASKKITFYQQFSHTHAKPHRTRSDSPPLIANSLCWPIIFFLYTSIIFIGSGWDWSGYAKIIQL